MKLVTIIIGAAVGLMACSSVEKEAARPTAKVAETVSKSGPEESDCTTNQELDPYRLLKRLSLDLRERLPSYEEYSALDGQNTVPESTIDAYITSADFGPAMRRYHEDLLWTNPAGAQLQEPNALLVSSRITTDSGETLQIYNILGNPRRGVYRGTSSFVCGPWLQTEFNADGTPVAKTITDPEDPSKVYYQEGYVKVHPYWSPTSEIYVCAFDAQTAAQGETYACNTLQGQREKACGCGPDLRWCFGPGVQNRLWLDLREQLGLAVDRVTVGGHAYTDLLTSTSIQMNGALSFWKKNLAQMVGLNRTYNAQGPGDPTMPDDPDFLDTTWIEYQRSDIYAGIQTLPAYTLRFQTNRGRANRFRIAFNGQSFVPLDQPENPETSDCEASADDLTQMCTCRYCHQTLEPLAAHFGKVSEAGSSLISSLNTYEAQCDPRNYVDGGVYENRNGIPASCERFYSTQDSAQNPGWLIALQFAYTEASGHNNEGLDDSLHRAIYENYEAGPLELANAAIDSGELASATVKNLFRHMMGRDMILDASLDDNELELLSTLTDEFKRDFDFPSLVKQMVMLSQYRRVR